MNPSNKFITESPPIFLKNPLVESYALYPKFMNVENASTRKTPALDKKSATLRAPVSMFLRRGACPIS